MSRPGANPIDSGIQEALRETFGADPTVTDAEAMSMPWFIDEDDFDFDFGPDIEASIDARRDYELEQDVENEFIEGELGSLIGPGSLDEEVDEMFSDEEEMRMGRRAMAQRARAGMHGVGSEAFGAGFGTGYVQALRDMGVNDAVISEQYGGLFSLFKRDPDRVARRDRRATRAAEGRGLGSLFRAGVMGLTGGKGLSELAEEAGTGVRETVLADRLGPQAAIIPSKRAPRDTAAVEADSESLPPTYVEDEQGFSEDIDEQEDNFDLPELQYGLVAEDRFGVSCKYGLVDSQPREDARKAAKRAVQRGSMRMKKAKRKTPRPFVEDPDARPTLFSDGKIWEPVYGAMSPVPCPSCTRVHPEHARKGAHQSCVVCKGYGALLVPESDVDTFISTPSYGFLGLLLGGAKLAATAAPALASDEGRKQFTSMFSRKKAERLPEEELIDEMDDDEEEDVDAEPEQGEVVSGMTRCLVPTSWWKKRHHGGS